MDSGCAPQWVLPAHPLDQITQTPIDLWAPYSLSRFPAPAGFEASAMPPQDCLRFYHLGHTEQARPEPGHPYEQGAVTPTQSKTRRCPPQRNAELMTKEKIFGF